MGLFPIKIFTNIVQIKKSHDNKIYTFIPRSIASENMTMLSQLILYKNGVEIHETKYSLKEKLMSDALELGQ